MWYTLFSVGINYLFIIIFPLRILLFAGKFIPILIAIYSLMRLAYRGFWWLIIFYLKRCCKGWSGWLWLATIIICIYVWKYRLPLKWWFLINFKVALYCVFWWVLLNHPVFQPTFLTRAWKLSKVARMWNSLILSSLFVFFLLSYVLRPFQLQILWSKLQISWFILSTGVAFSSFGLINSYCFLEALGFWNDGLFDMSLLICLVFQFVPFSDLHKRLEHLQWEKLWVCRDPPNDPIHSIALWFWVFLC